MEKKDISTEEYRTYIFGDVDYEYTIRRPKDLYVAASGSHRVVDVDLVTHYIPAGWSVIKWYAPTEPVSF